MAIRILALIQIPSVKAHFKYLSILMHQWRQMSMAYYFRLEIKIRKFHALWSNSKMYLFGCNTNSKCHAAPQITHAASLKSRGTIRTDSIILTYLYSRCVKGEL